MTDDKRQMTQKYCPTMWDTFIDSLSMSRFDLRCRWLGLLTFEVNLSLCTIRRSPLTFSILEIPSSSFGILCQSYFHKKQPPSHWRSQKWLAKRYSFDIYLFYFYSLTANSPKRPGSLGSLGLQKRTKKWATGTSAVDEILKNEAKTAADSGNRDVGDFCKVRFHHTVQKW